MAWTEKRGTFWRVRYRDRAGAVRTLPEKYFGQKACQGRRVGLRVGSAQARHRAGCGRPRRRPVLDGGDGWEPIAEAATFHGLRHLHKTILDELDLPEVLKHDRMGHRMRGISGVYSQSPRSCANGRESGSRSTGRPPPAPARRGGEGGAVRA